VASSNVKTPLQWLADVYKVGQGYCFEGNVAYMIVSVLYLAERK